MNTVTFTTVLGVTGLLLSLVGLILGPYFVWRRARPPRPKLGAVAAPDAPPKKHGKGQEKKAGAGPKAASE